MLKNLHSRSTSSSEDGFSLMEIILVLAIIAILSSISMPLMQGFAASRRLKTSAQAIADTLAFARDMAITEKTTHLVVFDVDANTYWLASSETFDLQNPQSSAGQSANTTASTGGQVVVSRSGGVMGVPKQLGQGITISALITNHNDTTRQITSGVDFVYFSPTATSEDTIVYLQNTREKAIAITVEAATGRTNIEQMTTEQIQTAGLGNNL